MFNEYFQNKIQTKTIKMSTFIQLDKHLISTHINQQNLTCHFIMLFEPLPTQLTMKSSMVSLYRQTDGQTDYDDDE